MSEINVEFTSSQLWTIGYRNFESLSREHWFWWSFGRLTCKTALKVTRFKQVSRRAQRQENRIWLSNQNQIWVYNRCRWYFHSVSALATLSAQFHVVMKWKRENRGGVFVDFLSFCHINHRNQYCISFGKSLRIFHEQSDHLLQWSWDFSPHWRFSSSVLRAVFVDVHSVHMMRSKRHMIRRQCLQVMIWKPPRHRTCMNPSIDGETMLPMASFVHRLSSQSVCEDPIKKVPIVQVFYKDAGSQHSIDVPADGWNYGCSSSRSRKKKNGM